MHPDDQRKTEELTRKIQEENEKLALAYGEIFRSEAGKLVLKDLRSRCNVDNCSVRQPNNPDPNSVLFEEGKRAVWNHIMLFLRHDNERRKSRN